jgi:hypothetical protein
MSHIAAQHEKGGAAVRASRAFLNLNGSGRQSNVLNSPPDCLRRAT